MDIFSQEPKFSDKFNHAKLPTTMALEVKERTNKDKVESLKCFTEFIVLTQKRAVVTMEPKPENQGFNLHVISVFTEDGKTV